jgi:(2Fe-2S) ferredoxin
MPRGVDALASFAHHIFICTNTRPAAHPRGCCNPDGAAALRERFKDEVKRRSLQASVRANAAGCLDQCEHGPTVVVYPEGVWYGGVQPEDVAEILESHIGQGRTVERLRLAPGCINTKSCAHKPRVQAGSKT